MIPFTEFFTGAVYISPSGILHSPQQGIIGISLILKVKSVFGDRMQNFIQFFQSILIME